MADTPTTETPAPNRQPDEKPDTDTTATGTPETETPSGTTGGAGSKDAVLADLAAERDKRQAAEQASKATADKLQAVLNALGLAKDEHADPAKEAETWRQQVAERDRQLAVLRNAPTQVDAQALLDSRSFLTTLEDIDPNDQAAVTATITGFVDSHPRFSRTPSTTHGARDLAQPTNSSTSSDPLAAALTAAVGKS